MAESYRRWQLPQLWEMVAADDAANAHLHLATLRRQQTALETQRDRLRTLRDQLAEAWPPEKSQAATMFLQRLNDMIDAVTATALGAAEVRVGVDIITGAISQAHDRLAPLVERYEKAESVLDPRVGLQARKLLDQEARQILMSADNTVREAAPALRVALPDYERISMQADVQAVDGGTKSTGGGNSGTGSVPGSPGRLSGFIPPRFDPPSPVLADVPDDEVVLAQDPSGGPGDERRPGVSGLGNTGNLPVRGSYEAIGAVGRVLGAGPMGGAPVSSTRGTTGGLGPGGTRGIPGNVIGGAPATSARGGAMRAPLSTQRSSPAPLRSSAGAGGHQDRSYDEYVARQRGRREEHDEQWTVVQGVTPLLEARPLVDRHDAGPGVIGLDR